MRHLPPGAIDQNARLQEKLAELDRRLRFQEGTWDSLTYNTVTFKNGWTGTCLYAKDLNGRVFLSGRISGGSSGTVAFNIPGGFRTKESNPMCAAGGWSGSSVGAAFVNPQSSGDILVYYASGFGDVGIEGCNWRAEQ